MIDSMKDKLEIFVVIALTLFAKWLMTEEPIKNEEDEIARRLRRKRAYGGAIAGALIAYYGPELLILWSKSPESIVSGMFTSELLVPMTIILALSGEHVFRVIITKVPQWIDLYVTNRIKKG